MHEFLYTKGLVSCVSCVSRTARSKVYFNYISNILEPKLQTDLRHIFSSFSITKPVENKNWEKEKCLEDNARTKNEVMNLKLLEPGGKLGKQYCPPFEIIFKQNMLLCLLCI